jgi:hypothetical protein
MAELKTKKTAADVKTFLAGLADEQQREDATKVAKLMQKLTGAKPAMWGPSIVGFGHYRYVYDSGREMDWFKIGFAPRKGQLVLYGMGGSEAVQLKKLGKHKTGKGCLYIKKLADVDIAALTDLIQSSLDRLDAKQREDE